MKKCIFLPFSLILLCSKLYSQPVFSGSFIMTFQSAEIIPSLLWNIQSEISGGKKAFEFQDEMKRKGVSKKIVFDSRDSTWMMLMEFNKVKQGSRIHAAAMYRDTVIKSEPELVITKEYKLIDNYKCRKIKLESEKFLAELWITDKFNFNLSCMYELMIHCGLMNENIRKGDWFHRTLNKGMILEVTSTEKLSGETYSLRIVNLEPGVNNELFYSTNGFRISDIPEGQNCGAQLKE